MGAGIPNGVMVGPLTLGATGPGEGDAVLVAGVGCAKPMNANPDRAKATSAILGRARMVWDRFISVGVGCRWDDGGHADQKTDTTAGLV